MSTTYYVTNSTSDFSGGADFNYVVSKTAGTASETTITIAKGATETSYAWTASGDPSTLGTSTGTYSVEVDVTTGESQITLAIYFERVNSSGTVQATQGASQGSVSLSAGVKTYSYTNPSLGTWASGDRLRLKYTFVNTAAHSNLSVGITFNDANSEAVMPWTDPNATVTPATVAATTVVPTPDVNSTTLHPWDPGIGESTLAAVPFRGAQPETTDWAETTYSSTVYANRLLTTIDGVEKYDDIYTLTGPHDAPGIFTNSTNSGLNTWITSTVAEQVTVSGTIYFSLYVYEESTSANASPGWAIWVARPDGTESLIVSSNAATEVGTTFNPTTPITWSATATSTTLYPGDVIVAVLYVDDAPSVTMGYNYIVRWWYQSTARDSTIKFSNTIYFVTDAPAGTVTKYLADASDISGTGKKKLWTDAVSSQASYVTNTVAFTTATKIQITDTGGGNPLEWYTPQLQAVTIEGEITARMYAMNNYTYTNWSPGGLIYKTDSDGSNPVQIGEFRSGRGITIPTNTLGLVTFPGHVRGTLTDGQRIKIVPYLTGNGGGAGGYTVTLSVEDTTVTSITWPTTLTEYVPDATVVATVVAAPGATVPAPGHPAGPATVAAVAAVRSVRVNSTTLYLASGEAVSHPRPLGGPLDETTTWAAATTPAAAMEDMDALGDTPPFTGTANIIGGKVGPHDPPGVVLTVYESPTIWVSKPVAEQVTIDGDIDFKVSAREVDDATNASPGFVLWAARPNGTQDVIVSSNAGVELSTTNPPVPTYWGGVTPTSTTLYPGDVLVAAFYIDDAPATTMSTGNVYINFGNAGTENEDSYIGLRDWIVFDTSTPAGTVTGFLADASDVSGTGKKKLWTDTPSGLTEYATTTVPTATSGITQWTDTGGGNALEWYTPTLEAVDVAGPFAASFRVKSSSSSYNASVGCRVYKTDSDGSNPVQIGEGRAKTEPSTGYGLVTFTGYMRGSLVEGERIKVVGYCTGLPRYELYSSYTVTVSVEYSTPTQITWPATLTEYVGSADATVAATVVAAPGAAVPLPSFVGNPNATVSNPTVVAATAAVPTPTVTGTALVSSPTVVAGTAAVPAPGHPAGPATVTATATVPTPTVAGHVAITATTVAAGATVPAPDHPAGPATVTAVATVPTPTVAGHVAITATTVVSPARSVPTPTVTGTALVSSPTVVAGAAAVPAPTVSCDTTVSSPTVVAGVGAVGSPTVAGHVTVTATVVAAPGASVPAPGHPAGPATVTAATAVPAPSVAGHVAVTGTTVADVAAVPAPTVTGAALVANPSAVAGASSVPTPTVTGTALVANPTVVAAAATVPTPTVTGTALVANPTPVAGIAAAPKPVVSIGPTTVAAPGAGVPGPTVAGGADATGATVAAIATVPAPSVTTTSNATVAATLVTAPGATVPQPSLSTSINKTVTTVAARADVRNGYLGSAWVASDYIASDAAMYVATDGTTLATLIYDFPGGTIYYTTDPLGTWTQGNSVGNYPTFLYYANGYWVIGSANGTYYTATSVDGTWTQRSIPDSGIYVNAVCYANGTWVIGAGSDVYTSSTITGSWTKNTGTSFGTPRQIVYADSRWVLMDTGNGIYTTTDPAGTWTSGSDDISTGIWYDAGTDTWVGGAGPWVATDPAGTWTETSEPDPPASLTSYISLSGAWIGMSGTEIGVSTAPATTWKRYIRADYPDQPWNNNGFWALMTVYQGQVVAADGHYALVYVADRGASPAGHVTVTPATVAAVATVPASTVTGGADVSAGTVTAVGGVPAPTMSAGVTVATTPVAAVTAVPGPSLTTDSTVTATEVASTVAVPTPSITAQQGATVAATLVVSTATVESPGIGAGFTVSPVDCAAVLPAPTPGAGVGIAATPVAGVAAVPPPTVAGGAVVPAAVVAVSATVPDPAVAGHATVTGSPAGATTTVPPPAVAVGSTAATSVTAATTAVPTPSVTGESNATVTPDGVQAVSAVPGASVAGHVSITATTAAAPGVTVPTPTVFGHGEPVTATPVAAAAAVPGGSVDVGSTVAAVTVDGVTTVPTPSVSAGSDATIGAVVVAVAAEVPAPAVSTGSVLTPGTVAVTAAAPAPTLAAGSDPAPSQVAVPGVGIGTPTVTASSTATPVPVAGYADAATPTVSGGVTVPGATVAASAAVPGAVVSGGGSVSAAVVAAAATVPTPTVAGHVTTTPTFVAGVAAVGSPSVSVGSTVTATEMAAVAAVPTPGVTAQGNAAVSPAPVDVAVTVPAPVVSVGSVLTPGTVSASSTVPAPTVGAGVTVTVGAVTAVAAVGAPTLSVGSAITAPVVAAAAGVPAPGVVAGVVAPAATITVNATLPTPTVTAHAAVTGSTVAASTAVPGPTVAGHVTVATAPVTAAAAQTSPTVTAGAAVTATATAATVTVPAPGITTDSNTTVTPAAVTATSTVPDATVATTTTVTAATVAAAATVPGATVACGTTTTPDTVAATVAVPAPYVSTPQVDVHEGWGLML